MAESLIPESPLVVSPSLAASIGLENALLLQHLDACSHIASSLGSTRVEQGLCWHSTSLARIENQLPFWTSAATRRILQDLVDLGLILIEPFPVEQQTEFSLAINQQVELQHSTTTSKFSANTNDTGLGAHKILSNWQPEDAVIHQLLNKGIAHSFILESVEEFVLYWRERNEVSHAWSSKFMQYVTRSWQRSLQYQQQNQQQSNHASTRISEASRMQQQWSPSEDALEILGRMGIHHNFIDDAIPEFILYWQERGEKQSTWNSKFVTHVKKQWARYTHTLKHDNEPRPMLENWQPDHEVFDVLVIANIDADFARSLIPEFVLYWRDNRQLHHSWNTKFLQYVKRQWSRNFPTQENLANGDSGQSNAKRRTRDRSLLEDLNDRSWAS